MEARLTPAWRRLSVAATAAALAVSAPAAAQSQAAGFIASACPPQVEDIASCHVTRDGNGAWLLAAIPKQGYRGLVVHAHGGPRLGAPKLEDSGRDLARYRAMLEAGYAWIGSSYRRGGYGVRSAAADVENSRRLFVAHWGEPARILLHGQSWGGNVAGKVAETYALDLEGRPNYHAVLTTNGVMTGGSRAYGFRADLRAVYQYYCGNHPKPDEAQYPLWQGLPADVRLPRAELERRVDACTGVSLPPRRRTPAQSARLADILAVTGIAEQSLVAHLAWATYSFRDLVQRRLGGANPFDNATTVYRGSRDDEALNAGVERFAADPDAVARLAYDADLSGLIVRPVLNIHAAYDPTVSAEALAAYRATIDRAGRGHLLAQARTGESDHSRLLDATYRTALRALELWLDTGARPDAASLQALCRQMDATPGHCRFLPP